MPVRRTTLLLARLALALFVLVQLAASAAPLLQPPRAQPVCSGHDGSVRWVLDDGSEWDGHAGSHAHGIHCPLCVPVGGPPSATPHVVLPHARPRPWRLFVRADAPVRRLAWAPLLARGPPIFS